MTIPSYTASGSFILFIPGLLFLLYGAWQAIRQRQNARRLILWGAVHDAGLICMALGAANAAAGTGVWLFVAFQLLARGLSWSALNSLAGPAAPSATFAALRGAVKLQPVNGALFALGLMASVGGSPFLIPEGRLFITQGILASSLPLHCGLFCTVLAAVTATVLIALHVDALRQCFLQPCSTACDGAASGSCRSDALTLVLGVLVALMGLARGPMLDVAAGWAGLQVAHATVHPAFWIYFAGAFVCGVAAWAKFRWMPHLGVLACAAALAATLTLDAPAPVALLFLVMIGFIAFIVSVYSLGYMAHAHRQGWYWFFLLLTFASLAGIVSTPDMAAMYGYWELMTFASYFLVVHEANRVAFDAGFKYYLMCAGGALLMLPGMLLLGNGGLGLADVRIQSALLSPHVLNMAALLCLVGFGVKAGLVPLHSWLPDAHPAAPSSVSGPLSGIITKMGMFGIVVLLLGQTNGALFAKADVFGLSWFGSILTFMGAATLIFGELMALKQDDIKRMLAYSTLGQLGEIALVLGMGTWLATAGALSHMLSHAIMKDLLFLGAGALILRAGSRKLADLRGLGQCMPWTVSCMAVGLICIMGLPPFTAFFSKYLMIQSAIHAGHPALAALILIGSLVGAIYYVRILKTLVFEERPADLPMVEEAPWSIRGALMALAALSLLLGLAPWAPLTLVIPVASACFAPASMDLVVLQSVMAPWPIYVAVPVFGALLPAFFRRNPIWAARSSAFVLLLTAALVIFLGRDLDTLSYCFALIVPLIGALNVFYAQGYMSHSHTQWRFYCAFTAMCGGLVGISASTYLFQFFLFWEIMSSWTLYMAIAHEGDKASLREAFKYFFFNVLGAGFIFVGVCVLGPATPFSSESMQHLTKIFLLPGWVVWGGTALLAIGFVMKAAQLPFRIDWQMHPALAPTPVSGYISSVLLKSSILGLIKLFMLMGGSLAMIGASAAWPNELIQTVVMWIGGITIVMAATQALLVNNVKLVFIYSTVSQIGYMVLAVAAGGALGYAGGMLHVINHVFFKDLLFLVCGAVMFATHADSLDDLGGIGRKMPFTLCMFAIAGLSVVGVPPTSGFSSKWIIYHALMQADQPFLALLSLVGSVLTLAYIAKFLHAAFLGQPSKHLDHVQEAPLTMRVPMAILAIGCIITGIFPGLMLWPINAILGDYNAGSLVVGLSGLQEGPGAWNATGLSVMMVIAAAAGWYFVRRFVVLREVDVHTCGLPTEVATSRMAPSGIYGGLVRRLAWFPGNTSVDNKS